MGRILDFLSGLDDYELAFFAKYKRNSYMKQTQEIISEFLITRSLSESQINRLISENPKSKLKDGKERCPRCYSSKIRKDAVEWTNTGGGIGIEDDVATLDGLDGRATYKNEVICNVCGFWLVDPNQEKPLTTSKKIINGIRDFIIAVLRN